MIARFMSWLEHRHHMTDAYLAQCRGDKREAADCYNRAQDVIRRMELMEIGHG